MRRRALLFKRESCRAALWCRYLRSPLNHRALLSSHRHFQVHDEDNRTVPVTDGLTLLLLGTCLTSNDNSNEQLTRQSFMDIIRHRIGVRPAVGCLSLFDPTGACLPERLQPPAMLSLDGGLPWSPGGVCQM